MKGKNEGKRKNEGKKEEKEWKKEGREINVNLISK